MDIFETLKAWFNNHVGFREKRSGVIQVLAPIFHEDGDMIDVFLDLSKGNERSIRLNDHGLTLMRLSYSYDIDTPNKRKIFDRILAENGVSEDQGRLFVDTDIRIQD